MRFIGAFHEQGIAKRAPIRLRPAASGCGIAGNHYRVIRPRADASARARDRGLAVDARDREAVAAIRDWMAHAGANDDWRAWDGNPEGADRVRSRALTGRDFVTGTSFALTGGSAEAGGYAALWGRGAISRFDGREGELTLDGEVTTGLMGADLPPVLRRPHDYHAAHPTPIPLRAAPGTPSPP